MKRILVLFILISSIAHAQTDNPSKYTYYRYLYGNKTARLWADSIFHLPGDTASSAQENSLATIGGVLYVKGATKWDAAGGSGVSDGNNYPTSLGFNTATGDLTIDRNGLSTLTKNLDGRYALLTQSTSDYGLVDPGTVTWTGSGLVFDVTAATYYINGTLYNSPASQITLDAADPTNPRIDVIAVDNTGTVVKITGDAASNPVEPQVDPGSQVFLTSIQIAAGATVPTGVSTTMVYDENVEGWTLTPQGVTVNANNTSNVYQGSKSMDISGWSNLNQISLHQGSALNASNYSAFKMFVKLKAALSSSANITVTFYSGSTAVSNEINITGYGLSKSNTSTYQNISIPFASFVFSGAFDKIRIRFPGSNASGVYLDAIQLQSGVNSSPTVQGLTNAYTTMTDGTNNAISSGSDKFKIRSSDNTITPTVTNNDATHGDNVNLVVNSANLTGIPQSGVTGLTTSLSGKEDVSNKSTSTSLGTSNTLYPTQNAVKSYVDAAIAAAGGYTDEQAQDAIGAMVSSEFTYTDATPLLAINVIAQSKITNLTTDLAAKQATLVSGTNIKTVNSTSLLGSGNLNTKASLNKTIVIESPSATENLVMWKTPVAITITSVESVLVGSSPSVTFQLLYDANRGSVGNAVFTSGRTTTSTTTGDSFSSSFSASGVITAGSWIWITTSAKSGTVTQLELVINYTEN